MLSRDETKELARYPLFMCTEDVLSAGIEPIKIKFLSLGSLDDIEEYRSRSFLEFRRLEYELGDIWQGGLTIHEIFDAARSYCLSKELIFDMDTYRPPRQALYGYQDAAHRFPVGECTLEYVDFAFDVLNVDLNVEAYLAGVPVEDILA